MTDDHPKQPDDDQPSKPPADDERDWLETAVKIAGALGFNPVRARWRLQQWRNRYRAWQRRAEQQVAHVRYQHKTCPECGAVQDREARTCSSCSAKLGARSWQVLHRLGLSAPQGLSISMLLGASMVAVYVGLLAASPNANLFDMPNLLLVERGGSVPIAVRSGDWWRLGTSIFLHAGLWHIGFNLFALSVIGPRIEELYGRLNTVSLFMVTGILASLGSALARTGGVGIGASGALMGLIGVAAAYGHRQGTGAGRELRNDMLKWTAYVLFFGFLIGADNWAHSAGLLSGVGVALAVPPGRATAPAARPLALTIGAIAVVAAIASIGATFYPPASVLDAYLESLRAA